MPPTDKSPVEALILAVPETAGSTLYGMVDVLSATGNIWQTLTGAPSGRTLIRPRVVALSTEPFDCGYGIPVKPAVSIEDDPKTDILILPELWLGPDEHMTGRYPDVMNFIRCKYAEGASIYAACSGAVMLAASGLLDNCEATSHWSYDELFRRHYPNVRFRPEPNLVIADANGRIVTSGGITSWHDLALHIIAQHCSPGDALRIAKVYLLKWHAEGQLPFASLVRRNPHADSVVRACEDLLGQQFRGSNVIQTIVAQAQVPERTLQRRFKSATGTTLMNYLHNLRVEHAKRLLESTHDTIDRIIDATGYEDPAFFRRLFKRRTGLTPSQYRRMFQPVINSADYENVTD